MGQVYPFPTKQKAKELLAKLVGSLAAIGYSNIISIGHII